MGNFFRKEVVQLHSRKLYGSVILKPSKYFLEIWMLFFLISIMAPIFSLAQELKGQASVLNARSCFDSPFDSATSWLSSLENNGTEKISTDNRFRMTAQYDRYRNTIVCENFEYKVSGVIVRGFYIAPAKTLTSLPLVIFNRGGNGGFGSVYFGYQLYQLFPLAERGFVIVGSQYRGSDGDSDVLDEFGGKDVEDVLTITAIAKKFPKVNPSKIGMYGVSRGGMQTYLAAKATNNLSAIVIQSADSDLLESLKSRPEMEVVYRARISSYDKNKVRALTDRSAIYWVDKLPKNAPILLLHGDKDERADYHRAIEMDAKLNNIKREHKLIIYPDDNHALSKHRKEVLGEVVGWFDKYLR